MHYQQSRKTPEGAENSNSHIGKSSLKLFSGFFLDAPVRVVLSNGAIIPAGISGSELSRMDVWRNIGMWGR